MSLIKKVSEYSTRNNLWTKGSKIIIGVSGGPDSVCLLDIFSTIKKKHSLNIAIAHVNYGLRGEESDQDEKFVTQLAKKYAVPLFVLRKKISGKSNLESRLRTIRYAFLEKIRTNSHFDLIAVGHNQDDQAETFLLRLIRGAGPNGLSAMSPKSDKIIRPLLKSSRNEILEYINKNKMSYRTDSTNLSPAFDRNRIRLKLLPLIEKEFNSQIKKTLARNALLLASENDFLEKTALAYREKSDAFSAQKFLTLHPAIQQRLLRNYILTSKKDLLDITHSHIDELLKAIRSRKNKHQTVSLKGLKLVRKGDKVILS